MEINTLRSLATVLLFIGFMGLCFWVFFVKKSTEFDEAANLPFADDEEQQNRQDDLKSKSSRITS